MKAPRQIDIIGIRARPAAQRIEIEPDNAPGAAPKADAAALDIKRLRFILDFGDAPEFEVQRLLARRAERRVIHLGRFERPPAVIDTGIDIHHHQTGLDQFDRRQEAGALQAIFPEQVGMVVRGHAQHDPVVEQMLQQATENHRVGDVVDVKFVETDQPILLGDILRQVSERVFLALEFVKRLVHVAHEVVEMHAAFLHQRHAQVKAVHQEAFSPPDTAPQINPARQLGLDEESLERGVAARLVADPLVVQLLQYAHRGELRLVADVAAAGDHLVVVIENRQVAGFGGRVDIVDRVDARFNLGVAHKSRFVAVAA